MVVLIAEPLWWWTVDRGPWYMYEYVSVVRSFSLAQSQSNSTGQPGQPTTHVPTCPLLPNETGEAPHLPATEPQSTHPPLSPMDPSSARFIEVQILLPDTFSRSP